MKAYNNPQTEKYLTVNELKDAVSSQKLKKSSGYDERSFNIIKKLFLHILNASLQNEIFSNAFTIARVTPLYKNGNNLNLQNYRPISVLTYFSKILEKVMYNRLYKYLSDNNILYRKQFGFQGKLLTEPVIMQLFDQINCNFEKFFIH